MWLINKTALLPKKHALVQRTKEIAYDMVWGTDCARSLQISNSYTNYSVLRTEYIDFENEIVV